jgi:hypothetical protein
MVQDAHGRFYEAANNGKLFYGKTADSGVAPGTSISTTGAFTLYNPKGSSVNLAILQGSMGYVSGTLGAGFVAWCANVNLSEAVPTGTAIVSRPGLLGAQASNGVALTTSTLAVAPIAIRCFATLGASLASTAVQPWQIIDHVDGAIVLPPGGAITLHGVMAAGSTPLVIYSVLWEEIDIN